MFCLRQQCIGQLAPCDKYSFNIGVSAKFSLAYVIERSIRNVVVKLADSNHVTRAVVGKISSSGEADLSWTRMVKYVIIAPRTCRNIRNTVDIFKKVHRKKNIYLVRLNNTQLDSTLISCSIADVLRNEMDSFYTQLHCTVPLVSCMDSKSKYILCCFCFEFCPKY